MRKNTKMKFKEEQPYSRVKYKKLNTDSKRSNMPHTDIKFLLDSKNKHVFSLQPDFETLSEENIAGDE